MCEDGEEIVIVGVGLGTSFCFGDYPQIEPGDCFQTLSPSDNYYRILVRQCVATSCNNAKAKKITLMECGGVKAKYTVLQYICKEGKLHGKDQFFFW